MDIIEYQPDLPIRSNRGPLHRLRSLLERKKLSRSGKAHVNDLLERELVEQLEGECYLDQIERRVNMADGEIRADQFLRDEQSKFQALTTIRELGYVAVAGRKQVNTINDYMRQTGELARRHPHLREQVEEMERQFLMKTGRSEEIA